MSKPVVTDKWAGNFECGTCRRKRLVGSEFSKKALDKHRKTNSILKCKRCVAEVEQKERDAAAKRAEAKSSSSHTTAAGAGGGGGDGTNAPTIVSCASCNKSLPSSSFNRSQVSKGEGKARCRACVEKALAEEEKVSSQSKVDRIAKARENVRAAEGSGNLLEIVKAEAELSALEAEH
eukprot:CAMPEP_0198253904 /NCGR_PEP_ID=MMETSP1447-20131203/4280_1 /TAXON_ID=420782 /ORGANISM="Chaetoceros dichaeta, Strain CCMP1751" /LENGTH=177 /DNA_ID=CAMNT_0043939753 /DNA_START=22 /DNA_END=552 /DNA_ORIENTATION=-